MRRLWLLLIYIVAGMATNAICMEEKKAAPLAGEAYLSNNVLRIKIGEKKSSTWSYKYNTKDWGESCYNEFFVVYVNGNAIKSDDFTIITPFSNPGGKSGSVKAALRYGNIEVARTVGLSPGNARCFKIIYDIKNIGQNSLSDIRFFQIVDFDIPRYDDKLDDKGWYTSDNDYIGVKDDEFFKNIIASNPKSTKHGMGTWNTVLNDDWKDGNLNGANTFGPGDAAVAKQFNIGNLSPNKSQKISITIWFGEPVAEEQIKIGTISYSKDDRTAHHTDKYPRELTVFRRAQGINVRVDFTGVYKEDKYSLKFKVQTPATTTVSVDNLSSGHFPVDKWSATPRGLSEGKYYEIFIPKNAAIGKYKLTVELCSNGKIIDTKNGGEFYVIFNPWKKADGDVYNKDFTEKELEHYVTGDEDYNYYGGY